MYIYSSREKYMKVVAFYSLHAGVGSELRLQ